MSENLEIDDLGIEEEDDESPFVEFDISVAPSDSTLELIANQINNGDIIIPFFQRKYVWNIEKASKLIESFLMGLPVPQVFLYVNKDDVLEIIDGQQRIMSIKYFFEGYFGEVDYRNRRQVFRLKGLSERSEYNGKSYTELSARDQRRLRNSTLRAINIKQLHPRSAGAYADSVFHIFERLNTGGMQLRPQEIRNAVYRGPIVLELQRANALAAWQGILGLRKPDKNQKDVELILRLFALFRNWPNYEKPMLSFLNHQMRENRDFQSERANEFSRKFFERIPAIQRALRRPFRPKGPINSAALEGVLVALLEAEHIDEASMQQNYDSLLSDKNFQDSISRATTDTQVLRERIKIAKSYLCDAAT